MSTTGARGAARGRPLTAGGAGGFRCSAAAEQRADDLAGTATHLAAFLVIEHHGPWGVSAPRDSRLPEEVKRHLTTHKSIKVLMARRHLRAHRSAQFSAFLAVPHRSLLLTRTFLDPLELVDVDLDAVLRGDYPGWTETSGPFLGVCTHGRHDVCCAERGRPVAAALCESRPEQTWEVSHVGGDRFSANMVILPEGLYYGRVDPASAATVADLHDEGRLDLDRLRGRSTHPMHVQYAEIALRRHLGEDRLHAVRLVQREGWRAVFDHEDTTWEVVVRRVEDAPARLTCGAERLNPVPVFELVSLSAL